MGDVFYDQNVARLLNGLEIVAVNYNASIVVK